MNQGKLDVVKQEMVRINIDILGISELKWMGMGEFNSDHYICYCGQESHRINRVALIINKSPKCSTRVQPQKWQNDLGSFPKKAIQHHSNPSLWSYHQCQRSWSWSVLWRPTRPPRTNTKKKCSIHHCGLECKSRKLRNTWSDRQDWPWRTKWSRAMVNWILPRECTGHIKYPFPATQEMTLYMDITKQSIPKSNWLDSLKPKVEKLLMVSKNKTWSWLWLRSSTFHSKLHT